MMLTLLVYAYATGVFSSRKIARKIDEDVAFRVLAGGNRPDFRTINRFRAEHLKEFKKLFVEIVRLAKRTGLLKLGTVALDGTKVKANASKHKAMSYQRLGEEEERLAAEIQQLIERAEQIDAAEDELYGEARGDEIPAELSRRESRVQKIREAKAALEAEQAAADRARGRGPDDDRAAGGERPQGGRSKYKRAFGEPEPKAQRNFSDPDSEIMKRDARPLRPGRGANQRNEISAPTLATNFLRDRLLARFSQCAFSARTPCGRKEPTHVVVGRHGS